VTYKLVVFDFDGTLADSFDLFLEVSDCMADRHGFLRLDRENLEALRSLSAREMIARQKILAWKMPLIAGDMRRLMTEDLHRIRLFDGTGEMLERLKSAGLTLAVVTSNSEPNVRAVLGAEIASLIDHYGCGSSLFGKAPKLRKALKVCGVEGARALSVGDELRDAEASREAGLAFAGVSWGYTRAQALAPHAVMMFETPADLGRRLAPGG
jgi:phosphoglycolate phosphatase